jgi:hypothetical protein
MRVGLKRLRMTRPLANSTVNIARVVEKTAQERFSRCHTRGPLTACLRTPPRPVCVLRRVEK